jgi:hypothetical protein
MVMVHESAMSSHLVCCTHCPSAIFIVFHSSTVQSDEAVFEAIFDSIRPQDTRS